MILEHPVISIDLDIKRYTFDIEAKVKILYNGKRWVRDNPPSFIENLLEIDTRLRLNERLIDIDHDLSLDMLKGKCYK